MTKECNFLGNVCPERVVIGLYHKFRAEEENINPNPLRLGRDQKSFLEEKTPEISCMWKRSSWAINVALTSGYKGSTENQKNIKTFVGQNLE